MLLLEAGDEHENYHYQIPAFHFLATEDKGMRWYFFVRHYSDEAQQRRNTKFVPEQGGVLYPRAGTLGGCSAHNAMITVYPHNQDWDEIAYMTDDASWSSQHMRTYFERLERCEYRNRPCPPPRNRLLASLTHLIPGLSRAFRNESRHGYDGWLGTQTPDPTLVIHDRELLKTITSAAEQALVGHLGRPLTPIERLDFFDPNDWRAQLDKSQGLWRTPLATSAGHRNGTRDEIREFIKNEAWGHHASCSCKMGVRSDRMAVVDSNFRVYGVNNLRIVDASIFPHIPGFFIVTPIYMISEKASDVILAENQRSQYLHP